MTVGDPGGEPETLVAIRKLLLGALVFGVVGTLGELVLLGHFEMPTQWIPFLVLAATAGVIAWHAATPSELSVRAMQVFMALLIATGTLGVGLHLDGNVEFERELHPEEQGFEFLRKVVAGATPVLAPGSMVLLGLVGLAHTYRHRCTTDAGDRAGEERET
jgi:hypothetical protein